MPEVVCRNPEVVFEALYLSVLLTVVLLGHWTDTLISCRQISVLSQFSRFEKFNKCGTKVGRGNSGHGVIRATSTLQQERSIHWILASSEL